MSQSPPASSSLDAAYELLAARAPQAIVIVQGAPPRVVLANEAVSKLVGIGAEELQRLPPEQVIALLHPDDRDRALERQQARVRGDAVSDRAEYRLNLPSGDALWIEAVTVPIEYRGEPAVQVSCHDITERKRTELTARTQQEQQNHLDAVTRRAQMIESLGLLAGGVAHDFNNFLMGFATNIALLRHEIKGDEVPTSRLNDMETAVLRAAELCQQLLTYSGRGLGQSAALDLNNVVSEMAQLMKASVSPRITLQLELASELPTIEADPTQVRQVVMNLLHNASDALGDAPGVVTIRTGAQTCDPELRAACFPGDCDPGLRCSFIEVEDAGCGMDPSTLERAFEPFFSTKEAGRGLGLAAVLGILRSHGGGLHVQSAPGDGTVIRALLPVSEAPPEVYPSPPRKDASWRANDRVILIVDDDALTLDGLSMLLEHFGFRVLRAAGGRSALRLYKEHHESLSAVVLDYLMPDMDGLETLSHLRKINPDVPVILSSGCAGDEARTRFQSLNVAGYLRKPYEVTALVDQLRRIMKPKGNVP